MAMSLSAFFLVLLISSLDWLSTRGSFISTDQDPTTSSAPSNPHFTDCVSPDQMTFRCWWSPGNFHNLSSPGSLRLFYRMRDSLTSKWLSGECPEYVHSNRECFFDSDHTKIWVPYCIELRSQNGTYQYETRCFRVEDIVRPDPPVSVNWTLLDISSSGLNYDVLVNWDPPPSADTKFGWMNIMYEVQYKDRNATNWEILETQRHTKHTIYALKVGKEYEVHIRSKLSGYANFGEFSDPIYIQVAESPNKDSAFPLTLAIVFGAVGILVLIMFIIISQQHRLMMILLPPIPAPKIKGIDSQMLKKGKFDELNFILGGLPTYGPEFYQDEPWVEVIEVGAEDTDNKNSQVSDTQWLLGLNHPAIHHMSTSSSNVISLPNEGSGPAGCCDPSVSIQDTLMLMATLLPGQTEDEEDSAVTEEKASAPDSNKTSSNLQTGGPQTWINTDFYAQVSNVMPSGGVVLSPGQQLKTAPVGEEKAHDKAQDFKDSEEEVEEKQPELQFQLLVVVPEDGCYTAESSARPFDTAPCSPDEGHQTAQTQPLGTKPAESSSQSPYVLPGSPQTQNFAPVADYTVVQEFDRQHSLLLNPTSRSSPPPCTPQRPLKALPTMPVGYITPDLLGNISP